MAGWRDKATLVKEDVPTEDKKKSWRDAAEPVQDAPVDTQSPAEEKSLWDTVKDKASGLYRDFDKGVSDFVSDPIEKSKEAYKEFDSRAAALGEGAFQGVTLGHGDEALAGIGSAIYDIPYDEAADLSRQPLKKAREEYPATTLLEK